nr:type VII secretion protein EccCa [Salana multivorans]
MSAEPSVVVGRLAAPDVPSGTVTLQPPPELVRPEGASGALMSIMPVVGSVGSIALISFGAGGPGGQTRILMGAGILVASLGFVVVNLLRQRSQHRARVTSNRREYLFYLADLRESVRAAGARQRRAALWQLPDPPMLPLLVEEGSRVWERAPVDPDFLHARFGTGDAQLCLELLPPETAPLAQLDPVAASAAHRFLLTHAIAHDLPLPLDLQQHSHVEVAGLEAPARALARAMLVHLAAFASPEHLRIVVVAGASAAPEWEWVKWLPHAWSPSARDGAGPRRLVTNDVDEALELAGILGRPDFSARGTQELPHVVVVLDGVTPPLGHDLAAGLQGVTVLDLPAAWNELDDPARARLLLRGRPGEPGGIQVELLRPGVPGVLARADALGVAEAEAAARRLTRHGLPSSEVEGTRPQTSAELVDLLGLGDVRDLDVTSSWRRRALRDRLRVPIGLTPHGQPVHLDIKEAAQGGMGPHGLIIGATGSGKSEVLRTLVLALAMTHSSEDLNFVLVDFKGGATFAGMSDLPHVSAIITNLGQELSLVDRMQDALRGEMTRRQELLRAAGNFTNVTEYEKARATDRPELEPLPALLIVCDEFSELLSAKPEFTELFVAIGRLGRSLQMHLLLSSQRLEEGRLRGLESHLSYRIGLRTFSAQESRAVLGVPDAYELPSIPGTGYLKPDTTTMLQFRAAYVSGPPPRRRRRRGADASAVHGEVSLVPFTAAPVGSAQPESADAAQPGRAEPDDARATFDIAVSRMAGHGRPAHRVWLEPLETPLTYDELMPDLAVLPGRGLHSPAWRAAGDFVLPLGMVDLPLEQRRETLTVTLSGAGGNLAVVGGPRSGKSTALRSVVTALALTHSPLEVQVYVMDFGGGTFAPLRDLPHVAGIATRSEEEIVHRMLAEVRGIVDARERFFREIGVDSIDTYRARRVPGRGPEQGGIDDGYGDVFLVIDGWSTLRADFDQMEVEIQALAARGLTYGLHVVVAAGRWMDFRAPMKDVLGSRVELRLGDPTDSEVDRRVAATVPAGRPGRGLATTKNHVLLALPTLADGVDHLVQVVQRAWTGPAGPKLRLLPERITLAEVRTLAGADPTVAPVRRGGRPAPLLLGIDEAALAPLRLDLAHDPHLYLFGDTGSGKSAFLRAYAAELRRVAAPDAVQIFAVDYRRALLGEIPEEYLGGYLTTHDQATAQLRDLADYLRTRLPGPDVTPAQLRSRSWWSGAEVVVMVDDYDLVATSAGNPLAALVPLLAQARDVGLHVVLTRRSGGASRALYDPVVQALRDLASPGILLSGDPAEGQLIGAVKARRAVPGRAQLVSREHGTRVAQLAWTAPTA